MPLIQAVTLHTLTFRATLSFQEDSGSHFKKTVEASPEESRSHGIVIERITLPICTVETPFTSAFFSTTTIAKELLVSTDYCHS